MDFKYSFLTSFLLFLLIKNISTQLKFSIILADENMRNGTYIRPAISEDGYLYLVTGEDDETNVKRQRYVIKYDINSASFVETIKYESDFGFWRGEPSVIEDSKYLFITTFYEDSNGNYYGSNEFFGLNDEKTVQKIDYSLHGYRRDFKKVGNYYYIIHLYWDNSWKLLIRKNNIVYKNNFPQFNEVNNNKEQEIRYQAMISCALTSDNNYILCAYYSGEIFISITVYSTYNLAIITTKKFDGPDYFTADNFIKIVYLKGDSNFIMMNSQQETVTRLKYFNYKNSQITDKLAPITKSIYTYLDISKTQYKGFNGDNDLMVIDSNKVIKIYSNGEGNSIIITLIQFYDNDSYMSIKIYNMVNDNGFQNMCQGRVSMLKNSFVFCLSATKNGGHRPGYFIINYPNSTDTNLDTSRIIINKLISLENQLYSVVLKFKILSIPNNFIFINKLDSLKVNVSNELELNDELILR